MNGGDFTKSDKLPMMLKMTYNPFNTAPPVRLLVKRTLRGSFWLFQMCPGQGTSVLSGVSRKGARRRSVGGALLKPDWIQGKENI